MTLHVIANEHAIPFAYKRILQRHRLLISRNSDKEGKVKGRTKKKEEEECLLFQQIYCLTRILENAEATLKLGDDTLWTKKMVVLSRK